MGAMFIDTWFAPSVRVASAFGGSGFGFGATIALRADTLRAAGGFEALRNRLADDYWLGQLTRKLGLATVLSDLCVATDVTEASFPALWWRERRWMQTIRSVNPGGYAFTFITFTFPMLAAGLALAPTALGWAVAVVGLAARCVPYPGRRLLVPARDCLLLLAWLAGCFGATTRWRQQTVPVKTAAYQEDRLR
jgi:ceramide glucosyltransferase